MEISEAIKELKSYKRLEQAIDQSRTWIAERKSTVSKVTSTLSLEGKGSKKHNDTMAEQLAKVLDVEAEEEIRIREMEVRKKVIYSKILKVEQPYQNILFNLYIIGRTYEETEMAINYSKAHIDRMRKEAVKLYSAIA